MSTVAHVLAANPRWLMPLALLLMAGASARAEGLKIAVPEMGSLRWQTRVQLSQLDSVSGNSRVLSANVLGDYYLTGSLLGPHTQGGLRATGGLLMGSPTLSQSSGGLALGHSSLSLGQSLAVGQRSVSLLGGALPPGLDSGHARSYLGIGYTGQSLRGGWGFSADLGLTKSSPRDELRLGRSALGSQSLEDLLMDMRFRPVLQLGLSYSY